VSQFREEIIGDARLILGDCREWLLSVPSCLRFQAMITDPPYGVGFSGKTAKRSGGGQTKGLVGYASFHDTAENVANIVVPAIRLGLQRVKRAAITPGSRNLFLYPPADDIGCFFSAAGTGMGRWGFTCSQPILYYGPDPFLEDGLGSRANSLGQTYVSDANESGHPCAKPIKQMEWLTWRVSRADETIIDPFMGSGTTGVACLNLGRKFIGIEIEPKYFDIACRRIEEAYKQPRLFDEPQPKIVQPSFFDGDAP
jgi:DNA modification methylase